MTRPRSDAILRRFLAGWTFNEILWHYRRTPLQIVHIERAIRNAMNRKRSRR